MKKFVSLIFALFYLSVASGASVNLHYCMDKLVDWSFGSSEASACSNCGMPKQESKKKACCKDVQQSAKIEKAQQGNAQVFSAKTLSEMPILFVVYNFRWANSQGFRFNNYAKAPPLGSPLPLFVKHCIYRI